MSEYSIRDTTLAGIANAIREKTGKNNAMTPLEMPTEIGSISTGGGDISVDEKMIDPINGIYRKSYYATLTVDSNYYNINAYSSSDFTSIILSTVNNLNSSYGITGYKAFKSDIKNKCELLWTNPSPTSAFAAQKISLAEMSKYPACIVNLRFHSNQGSYREVWCLGLKDILSCAFSEAGSNTSYGGYRAFTPKDDGVIFEGNHGIGYSPTDPPGAPEAIPTAIYGVPNCAVISELNLDTHINGEGVTIDTQNFIVTLDYKKYS